VWKRTARGRELHFYLAGINNQNFLMRDRETGSWWQQVTGRAISGPLAGAALELAPYDELTFGLWKSESPDGMVLAPVVGHEKDYEDDWEKEVAKYPVPVSFPGQGIKDRDVILGIEIGGQARAFPLDRVLHESPLEDKIAGIPVVLVTGRDGRSVRVFHSQWNGSEIELYRDSQSADWRLVDSSGNAWNFEGCAISGTATGQCLERIPYLKDFWFDWKNYHPRTSVYRRG
jgi:Protein of unknown function (DUF3179)